VNGSVESGQVLRFTRRCGDLVQRRLDELRAGVFGLSALQLRDARLERVDLAFAGRLPD
jgi:hypothetical protein